MRDSPRAINATPAASIASALDLPRIQYPLSVGSEDKVKTRPAGSHAIIFSPPDTATRLYVPQASECLIAKHSANTSIHVGEQYTTTTPPYRACAHRRQRVNSGTLPMSEPGCEKIVIYKKP